MKCFVGLLLLALVPAFGSAQQTQLWITSGSGFMAYNSPDTPNNTYTILSFAGSNFSGQVGFDFGGDACCGPLHNAPETPNAFWSLGFGAYGIADGGILAGGFGVNGPLGQHQWQPSDFVSSLNVSPVFIKGPGTYYTTFTFSINANQDQGSTCAQLPCTDFSAAGGGIATVIVTPYFNLPVSQAVLVDQVNFSFRPVPEPTTASLMVLAIGGLFGWRRIARRKRQ